jgi:hypothetical protein
MLNTSKGCALNAAFVREISSREVGVTAASVRGRRGPPVARPAVDTVEGTASATLAFRISQTVGNDTEGAGVDWDGGTGAGSQFFNFVGDMLRD